MRDPDIAGAGNWKAWKWGVRNPLPSFVGGWLLHCPGAHAFWSNWLIACCDLTSTLPGEKPAHKQYPEAQFEILFLALDPRDRPLGEPVDPDTDTEGFPAYLTPADLVLQFHGISRDEAAEVLAECARVIMTGAVSPDSDYRGWWKRTILEMVAESRQRAAKSN